MPFSLRLPTCFFPVFANISWIRSELGFFFFFALKAHHTPWFEFKLFVNFVKKHLIITLGAKEPKP